MIRFSTPLIPFVNRTSVDHGESRLRQYFDALVHQLHGQAGSADACRAVGVTSCRRGEGVSTITRNLGVASARFRGLKTLLMDSSGKSSHGAAVFDANQQPGLNEAVLGKRPLTDCVAPTPIENLFVMPAGTAELPTSALDAHAIQNLLCELKEQFEFILLDMPHADELSSCYSVAGALDGVVLVIEHEGVCGAVAQRVKQRLLQAGANLLGVVVNKESL